MRSPIKPSRSVFIWLALAALALALFAGMSLLALVHGGVPAAGEDTPTPTQIPVGDEPTPDITSSGAAEALTTPAPGATATPAPPTDASTVLGLWLSAVSAISALMGLASSLWLGWRKEGREAAQHQLELERVRLEIRKLQQDLEVAREDRRPNQPGP